MTTAAQLTEEEAAIYDRQLRVWGVETQRKLTSARVLVINCTGLAAELCKNIVLAGVGSVALMDASPASAAPPGNFLVPCDAPADATVASASAATLAEMNPLVRVEAMAAPDGAPPEALPPAFFASFRAVVLAGASVGVACAVNAACRAAGGVAFFAADCGVEHGALFADLGPAHTYMPQASKKADDDKPAPPPKPCTLHYCTLQDALAVPFASLPARCNHGYVLLRLRAGVEAAAGGARLRASDAPALRAAAAAATAEGLTAKATPDAAHVDAYAAGWEAESPAVAAVVGGILAQDVLKAVSGSGAPAHNFFLFDTRSGFGVIQAVGCPA